MNRIRRVQFEIKKENQKILNKRRTHFYYKMFAKLAISCLINILKIRFPNSCFFKVLIIVFLRNFSKCRNNGKMCILQDLHQDNQRNAIRRQHSQRKTKDLYKRRTPSRMYSFENTFSDEPLFLFLLTLSSDDLKFICFNEENFLRKFNRRKQTTNPAF